MPIKAALTEYRATGSETSFGLLYESIVGSNGNQQMVATFSKKYRLDEHDVDSLINTKIFEIARNGDIDAGKFRNAVFFSIRTGCIDLVRRRNVRERHYIDVMYEDEEGLSSEVYEVISVAPTTDETEIITEIQKRHDQRQLIASLLSKADAKTLTSMSAFLETNSYRKAAKLLDTSDKTIKSRIRKIAASFNEKQYGSYYDYFTVPTAYVG